MDCVRLASCYGCRRYGGGGERCGGVSDVTSEGGGVRCHMGKG